MHRKIIEFPAMHYLTLVVLRSAAMYRYLRPITLYLHCSSAATYAFLLHKFYIVPRNALMISWKLFCRLYIILVIGEQAMFIFLVFKLVKISFQSLCSCINLCHYWTICVIIQLYTLQVCLFIYSPYPCSRLVPSKQSFSFFLT
jgi:hypothetical protein